MKFIQGSILFLILAIFASCDNSENYVPYVPIRVSVPLNDYNDLLIPGNSMKLYHYGYAGLIVFCEFYDEITPANSIYKVYDACCTYELNDSCSVELDTGSFTVTCPCCNSDFSLYTGFPNSGAATHPLQIYSSILLDNELFISN